MKRPAVQVAFSATKVFADRWPDEAIRQQRAFEVPSATPQTCEEAHAALAMNPLLKKDEVQDLGSKEVLELMVFGACIGYVLGFGTAHIVYKWI